MRKNLIEKRECIDNKRGEEIYEISKILDRNDKSASILKFFLLFMLFSYSFILIDSTKNININFESNDEDFNDYYSSYEGFNVPENDGISKLFAYFQYMFSNITEGSENFNITKSIVDTLNENLLKYENITEALDNLSIDYTDINSIINATINGTLVIELQNLGYDPNIILQDLFSDAWIYLGSNLIPSYWDIPANITLYNGNDELWNKWFYLKNVELKFFIESHGNNTDIINSSIDNLSSHQSYTYTFNFKEMFSNLINLTSSIFSNVTYNLLLNGQSLSDSFESIFDQLESENINIHFIYGAEYHLIKPRISIDLNIFEIINGMEENF